MLRISYVSILVLLVWGHLCQAEVAIFVPSDGSHFGGQLVRDPSPNVVAGLSALEAAYEAKGGMLSRREILSALAKSDIEFTRNDVQLLSFASIIVQRPKASLDKLKKTYRDALNTVSTISGTTSIKVTKDKFLSSRGTKQLPEHSVYRWCVSPKGTSILMHSEGTPWFGLPLRSEMTEFTTTFVQSKPLNSSQNVFRLVDQYTNYLYPVWHPLMSARVAPSSDEGRTILSLSYNSELMSGQNLFQAQLYGDVETCNGVECFVYGDLARAIYVDVTDLRRIVGEVYGYASLNADGSLEKHLFENSETIVRLNETSQIVEGVVVPTKTRLFQQVQQTVVGEVVIKTTDLSNESKLSVGFAEFEPYHFVDSVENTTTLVGARK